MENLCLVSKLKEKVLNNKLPYIGEGVLFSVNGFTYDNIQTFHISSLAENTLKIDGDCTFCDSSGNSLGKSITIEQGHSQIYISPYSGEVGYSIKVANKYNVNSIQTTSDSPLVGQMSLEDIQYCKFNMGLSLYGFRFSSEKDNITDFYKTQYLSYGTNTTIDIITRGSLTLDAYLGTIELTGGVIFTFIEASENGFKLSHKIKNSGTIIYDGIYTWDGTDWTVTEYVPAG